MPVPSPRCIIYVRISKDDIDPADPEASKDRKVSMHLAEAREYAAAQDWPVAEAFVDPSVSASKFSKAPRPEFDRMIRWIEDDTGPAPLVVLTTEMERLYRKVDELLPVFELAKRTALRRIQTTNDESYDLSTANGIHAAIGAVNNAARESGKLSERGTRRQAVRAREGRYSGPQPFGYKLVPTGEIRNGRQVRELAIDPAEAKLIEDAAARVLAGTSLRSIELDWEQKGIRTRATSRSPGGNPWRHQQIRRMLISPLYAGIRVHRPATREGRQRSHPELPGGDRYPGAWEPILDKATHDAVRELLLRPPSAAKPETGRRSGAWPRRGTAMVHLLAGFLRCGRCGAVMRGYKHSNGSPGYRCPPAPYGCLGTHRAARPVEDLFAATVVHWLRPGGPYAAYLARARPAAGDVTARLAGLREDEAGFRAAAESVKESRRLPPGHPERRTPGEAREDLAVIESRLSDVTSEIDRIQRRRAGRRSTLELGMTQDRFDALSFAQKREHLEQLFDHAAVYPTQRGRLTFDPSKVKVTAGAWAADTDPADLAVMYAPAVPLQRDAALGYMRRHPGELVSPAVATRAIGGDLGHLSRAFKELAAAGHVVQVQQGKGRRPSLYVLAEDAAAA